MNKYSLAALASIAALSISGAAFAEGGKHKHGMMGGKHMMHQMMDTNADGSVSNEEFKAFRAKNFADADANGDGSLNGQEFEALGKIMKEKHKAAKKMAKQKKAQKHFNKLDADGDGNISRAEFDAKGERSFIRMDNNEDGVLNKEDRPKKMRKLKKMDR